MVTFICEYCDLTLKKKQCDKHVMGRCQPASLICIDCSKTFRGNQHKQHISCISQVDKHWGQYAPSKNQNQEGASARNQKNESTVAVDNATQQSSLNWKGWKNQIKIAFKDQDKQSLDVEVLKQKVLKRYHEEYQSSDKDEKLFMQKLQKLKKVKLTTYVSFE